MANRAGRSAADTLRLTASVIHTSAATSVPSTVAQLQTLWSTLRGHVGLAA